MGHEGHLVKRLRLAATSTELAKLSKEDATNKHDYQSKCEREGIYAAHKLFRFAVWH